MSQEDPQGERATPPHTHLAPKDPWSLLLDKTRHCVSSGHALSASRTKTPCNLNRHRSSDKMPALSGVSLLLRMDEMGSECFCSHEDTLPWELQWLGLGAFTARCPGLILGGGPKRDPPSWFSSKESTCDAGDRGDAGLIPRLGRSQKEEMATHSSILAWKTSWTGEPWRLRAHRFAKSRMQLSTHPWGTKILQAMQHGQKKKKHPKQNHCPLTPEK